MERFCPNKVTDNKIAIVGAGPAGIYCALHILKFFKDINFGDFSVSIFEKDKLLKTILPTGGGRCNITNSISDVKDFAKNYPRGEKFLYSIFSKHSNHDTIEYLNSIGLKTYISPDGKIFPVSNSSKDVRDKLLNELNKYKNKNIIQKQINSKNDLCNFDYIVIAAGSKNTQNLITSFNHTLIPFKKSLIGLTADNMIYPKGVSVKSLDGDFIFTEKGISGPYAFFVSSKNAEKPFPYELKIRLFNADDLNELIKLNPKKSIGNLVSKFIPRSLADIIVDNFNKRACEISKKEAEKYSSITLKITSTELSGEIVNAGGIELKELTNCCKSKINQNLWYCGEILNIDGLCGGFNLQNCWSTAYVVANDVVQAIIKQ